MLFACLACQPKPGSNNIHGFSDSGPVIPDSHESIAENDFAERRYPSETMISSASPRPK